MKLKKWIFMAGLACLCMAAAGCGKKEEPATEQPAVVADTPTPEPTPDAGGELVEMAVMPTATEAPAVEESYKNVAGDKNNATASVVVVNQMGTSLRSFFIRLHPEDDDDDEWGEDLIDGAFSLANSDVMQVYYEGRGAADAQSTLYDLRVIFKNDDWDEFYFRNIPLDTISRVTLLMEGKDEDAIPYCKYVTTQGKKEFSTLQEVKKRLGLLDDDEDEEDEDEDEEDEDEDLEATLDEPDTVAEAAEDLTPTPAPEEEAEEIDLGDIEGDSFEVTDDMSVAMGYVGSSLSALEGALGGANGSDYVEEPEMGTTGYHYYGSFTVSTTVGADGSEIVTGVW